MKKIIALILALILTLSVSPLAFAGSTGVSAEPEIWDLISEIERNAAEQTNSTTVDSLTAVYSSAVDEIIDAVTSSSHYVPGTLERHGNFFFWVDDKGDPNGYSPSYRAKRHIGAVPGAEPEDYAAIEIVNYGVKGGSPSSVDIAAFQPYIGIDGSFTAQYENRCNAIAQATGGVGTTYKTSNANVNNLGHALDTCGVVIFDSHGTTDYDGWNDYTSQANSSYLCLTTSTGITNADKASAQGEFGTYYHAFSLGGGDWAVDGTAITNHMTGTAPNSLVWMAICLGMATDGLEAPFRSRGAEVVYGYSQSVTFTGDYKYEGFFWPYMCQDHTVAEACAYMKTKSNCDWDPAYSSYSYSQAVANHVAFPIVSSSEDPYLGHGNVDVIQVPNSLWTLFTQFNIAASSNNDAWGTVTVSGRQITAMPAVGYEVVGYDVLSGTCTVTQNGNIFQVQAESDCEIRINFAARVPATVNFVAPEGVSVENFNGYVNDVISFPNPEGEPIADAYHYRFLGWAEAALDEDSQEMPIFHKAGESLTVTEASATYYALYKYFVAADGVTEGSFTLVTQAPASWAGDYVIVYHDDSLTKVLDATGEITGSSIGGSRAAHDLEEIGGTLEGNVLYNIPDEYIYTFEPAGNGAYALKMKEHDVYLALTSNNNALMTATGSNKTNAKWTLSYEPAGVKIANLEYNTRSIRFNDKAKLFRCYASGQQQISLYSAGDGTTWFTTNPKSKTVCEEHSFGDWTVSAAPTCTEPGTEKRVCTVCGFAETREIPALGHLAGEPARENEVEPTCTTPGSYDLVTRCQRCNAILSSEHYAIPVVDHTPGEPVRENEIAPTCTQNGSYEEAVYCTVCGAPISRTQHVIEATGHAYGDPVWTWTEALDAASAKFTCANCGDEQILNAVITEEVVLEPTVEAEGQKKLTAKVTFNDAEYTDVKTVPIDKLHDCPCAEFTDMPEYGTPEHEAIDWAYSNGYTGGVGGNLFGTGMEMTRAQAVVFLWAAAGKPGVQGAANPFNDVPDGIWFHDAVLWAVQKGITSGVGDGAFGPDIKMSRGQMMLFLYAWQGKPATTLNPQTQNPYSDTEGSWWRDAAVWGYEIGIDRGSNGVFDGAGKCPREMLVLWLYRFMVEDARLTD